MIKRALLAGMLGLLVFVAAPVSSASASPLLVIESPASGTVTSQTRPEFSGTTTDVEDAVTVTVSSGGTAVESVEATPAAGGGWSAKLPGKLEDGEYTAVAEQTETLTGETGSSGIVSFRVDTQPPTVTLDAVASPTNDSSPAFSGTASDTEPVTVRVYKGASAVGTVVAEAHAGGTGGAWTSGGASPALADGTYTAIAEQESSLGNGPGVSEERTFTVHTAKPVVTLGAVSSPTNDSTPSFSGTASEKTGVTVFVYAAGEVGGTVVAKATATGTGGAWSSGGASPALPDGTYTAIAEQESSFGNGPGFSQERTFTVHTAKPAVTLNAVSSPTADSTPSFSGTASETTGVTIFIFKGGSASGSPVAEAHASGTGGAWTSGGASPALADGTYTAVAEQESAFGDGPGFSEEQTFTVDTKPPKVTLNQIETPSGNQTPSFTGTASDTEPVTVEIFKGASKVTSVTAAGTGGAWSSGPTSELGEGTYTAVATQKSSHGTGTGESAAIQFQIIASPPKVTLDAIAARSIDSAPTFSGTASDTKHVTIRILSGLTEVAKAEATGTGGAWTSGQPDKALADGHYTAVAEQESSFGKGTGKSNEIGFTVDTSSPTVTLEPIATPSKVTTPTFSGTASDTTTVVVHVFDGADHEVASASGSPSAGKWKSGSLSKALSTGSYTAVAVQSSSLGNPPGQSENIAFTVNTEAPHVTLNAPAARSSNTTPSFSGTATDTTTVTVNVYKGTAASGSPVATTTAAGTGGAWASGPVPAELKTGTYTAQAVQKSSLGNSDGLSESRTFEVNTNAPEVRLNAPPARSNNTTPSFSGTASESTPVTVEVFKGTTATGSAVAVASAAGTGGAWSSGSASPALAPGTYTAIARQKSELANPDGLSEARTFVIDTSAPTVKLEALAALSNNATPAFKGTASDTEPVTVSIYAGPTTSGSPVATATGPATAGSFATGAAAPALASGSYTAVARQPSSIGNPLGESNKVSFAVNTSPPNLTLNALPERINNVTPTFSGTVVDNEVKVEPITVHIREAGKTADVATATASVASGKWTSGALTSALAKGHTAYEAFATQPSSIGNGEGKSNVISFTVDTNPPAVTLNPIATPSNNITPTFTGTATDTGPVTLEIVGGKAPIKVTVPVVAGAWSAGPVTLPSAKAEYVATASQASSIGNPTGKSKPIKFFVDPSAPSVFLAGVPGEIDTPTPTFGGTASGTGPVTVAICKVTTPCAAEQGEWTAHSAGGGAWSATLATPLPDGRYQAIASQRSATEALGATEVQKFTIDTVAPAITMTAPAQGATVVGGALTVQGAAGTAEFDEGTVTVELFAGSSGAPSGSPLQSVKVGVGGGKWSAPLAGIAPGSYTVRATQADAAGNVGSAVRSFVDAVPPAPASGPVAAFNWFPSHPHVGETVTLVSTSTDTANPITRYSWNLLASAFVAGGQKQTTSFATPGIHPVSLRVTDSAGLSSATTQQIPVSFPLMRPFPVVRIVSTRSATRVRVTLLRVEAPPGAIVTVSCKGKGCPLSTLSRLVARPKAKSASTPALTFPRAQRSFPAGVALEIRIAAAGEIGKYTRFAIRKGKLPIRSDACLNAREPRPVPCSS